MDDEASSPSRADPNQLPIFAPYALASGVQVRLRSQHLPVYLSHSDWHIRRRGSEPLRPVGVGHCKGYLLCCSCPRPDRAVLVPG